MRFHDFPAPTSMSFLLLSNSLHVDDAFAVWYPYDAIISLLHWILQRLSLRLQANQEGLEEAIKILQLINLQIEHNAFYLEYNSSSFTFKSSKLSNK